MCVSTSFKIESNSPLIELYWEIMLDSGKKVCSVAWNNKQAGTTDPTQTIEYFNIKCINVLWFFNRYIQNTHFQTISMLHNKQNQISNILWSNNMCCACDVIAGCVRTHR